MEFTRGAADFELEAGSDTVQGAAGSVVELKVKAVRREDKGPIRFRLGSDVEGVSIESGGVEKDKTDGEVKLRLAQDMAPGSLRWVRLIGESGEGAGRVEAPVSSGDVWKKRFSAWRSVPEAWDGWVAVGVKAAAAGAP